MIYNISIRFYCYSTIFSHWHTRTCFSQSKSVRNILTNYWHILAMKLLLILICNFDFPFIWFWIESWARRLTISCVSKLIYYLVWIRDSFDLLSCHCICKNHKCKVSLTTRMGYYLDSVMVGFNSSSRRNLTCRAHYPPLL